MEDQALARPQRLQAKGDQRARGRMEALERLPPPAPQPRPLQDSPVGQVRAHAGDDGALPGAAREDQRADVVAEARDTRGAHDTKRNASPLTSRIDSEKEMLCLLLLLLRLLLMRSLDINANHQRRRLPFSAQAHDVALPQPHVLGSQAPSAAQTGSHGPARVGMTAGDAGALGRTVRKHQGAGMDAHAGDIPRPRGALRHVEADVSLHPGRVAPPLLLRLHCW